MSQERANGPLFLDQNGVARIHPELDAGLTREQERMLVQKSVDGDVDAFGELSQHHMPRIHKYLVGKVGNKDDASDLLSSTFMNAFAAIPRYQERGVPFEAWLYRIAHNQVASHYREKREAGQLKTSSLDEKDHINPHTLMELREDLKLVGEALDQIPAGQRDVIVMRHVRQMDYKEVARELGISVNLARQREFRGLKKVRSIIGNLNTVQAIEESVA